MTERRPWKCPECGGIVAPHVEVHFCDGDPGGGVGAKRPVRPVQPPTTAAVVGEKGPELAALGGGGGGGTVLDPRVNIIVTQGHTYELAALAPVTVNATVSGPALFEAVQRETFMYRIRNGGSGGDCAA